MEEGSLVAHCQYQNGKGWYPHWVETPKPPDPRLYRVSLPIAEMSVEVPVEGCKGLEKTYTNLRIDFVHRHVKNTILMME